LRMDEVSCTGGEQACYEIIDEPSDKPQPQQTGSAPEANREMDRADPSSVANLARGSAHIPIGGGHYFTPAGIRKVAVNTANSTLTELLDPIGYRHVLKLAGVDIEGAFQIKVGEGDDDESQLVGSITILAASLIAGRAASSETLASPFRTVLEEQGAKILEVTTKQGVTLDVAFEEVVEGTTLRLKGVHIQGARPGQIGPKQLLDLARQYGKERGASRVIVEGAKRTTSSMSGRTPRAWILDVK
jgi:hypothetical protein